MKKIINKKFGKLVAIKFIRNHIFPKGNYHPEWLFKCDCGNNVIIDKYRVINGYTKSCGCIQKEKARKMGKGMFKHGEGKTRFYGIWVSMKYRCNDKNKKYIKKGIKVCKRWDKFENFKDDMYESYLAHIKKFGEKNTTIDRINNNGNYEPSNCRWATMREQNNNQSQTVFLKLNDKIQSVSKWSNDFGLSRRLVYERIKRQNWSIEKALTTPVGK